MALTQVQYAYATNTTTSATTLNTSATLSSPVGAAGRILVVMAMYKQNGTGPSAPTPTPTFGLSGDAVGANSLIATVDISFGSPNFDVLGTRIWRVNAVNAGSTITLGAGNLRGFGATSEIYMVVAEVSGQDTTTPVVLFDQSNGSVATTGPIPAQATIPSQVKLLYGCIFSLADVPGAVGGTVLVNFGNQEADNKTVTPGATDGIQWTSGGSGMQYATCQVGVLEAVVATPSFLPETRFSRINQGLFTR